MYNLQILYISNIYCLYVISKEWGVRKYDFRSIGSRNRSKRDLDEVRFEIRKLESDLNNAMEISNKCIAER